MARRSGHSTTKRAVARDAPRPGVRQAYARRSARLVACEAFGEAPRATSVQTYRRARNLVLQSWRLTALGPSARDPRARRTRVGLLRHAGHRVAYERVLFLTNATSPHQGLAGSFWMSSRSTVARRGAPRAMAAIAPHRASSASPASTPAPPVSSDVRDAEQRQRQRVCSPLAAGCSASRCRSEKRRLTAASSRVSQNTGRRASASSSAVRASATRRPWRLQQLT